MIDIHTHLLPGLDDGARDFARSLEMARLAVADGITRMIATPHSYGERGFYQLLPAEIRSQIQKLQTELKVEKIPLQIGIGMEVLLDEESLDYIRRGWLLPLADSDCLLCEFAGEDADTMTERLERVAKAGYRPIVAHPERYRALWKSGRTILEWKRRGWYLQLNAASLTAQPIGFRERHSSMGRESRVAWEMLKADAVFAVASDAHDLLCRPPVLSAARKAVEERLGGEQAEKLFLENPNSLFFRSYSEL